MFVEAVEAMDDTSEVVMTAVSGTVIGEIETEDISYAEEAPERKTSSSATGEVKDTQ